GAGTQSPEITRRRRRRLRYDKPTKWSLNMGKMSESLMTEFEREAQTTRTHFERLPEEKLDWRPHEKSYTAGALASHIVDCVSFADSIINLDEFDIDPTVYKPYLAASISDLLNTFDDKIVICRQALAGADDEVMARLWRFTIMGRLQLEKTKVDVFRD